MYESRSGNFKEFVHVFAIGNAELSRNCIFGGGSKLDGGSEDSLVANIKTPSTDTAAWPSAKKNNSDT